MRGELGLLSMSCDSVKAGRTRDLLWKNEEQCIRQSDQPLWTVLDATGRTFTLKQH